MRCLVTGSAGFVGSNLVDHLVASGHEVTGFDNLSTGSLDHVAQALDHPSFRQVIGDLADASALTTALAGHEIVFHLAAHADVRFGSLQPAIDLTQNTIGTFNVLEAMRAAGVRRIALASSGAVYGDAAIVPTPEDAPFPRQTSLYGASKLAAEGLVAAYTEAYGFTGYVFRLVSVLGRRYGHGHLVDFIKQLDAHPDRLDVLGDGHQRKSYVHVDDCVRAMAQISEVATDRLTIVNVGTDDDCEVRDSIRWMTEHLGLRPELRFQDTDRGWIGDSPLIRLDCSAARTFGWTPEISIRDAVLLTVEHLAGSTVRLIPKR